MQEHKAEKRCTDEQYVLSIKKGKVLENQGLFTLAFKILAPL
jgi:hypothetical protein